MFSNNYNKVLILILVNISLLSQIIGYLEIKMSDSESG